MSFDQKWQPTAFACGGTDRHCLQQRLACESTQANPNRWNPLSTPPGDAVAVGARSPSLTRSSLASGGVCTPRDDRPDARSTPADSPILLRSHTQPSVEELALEWQTHARHAKKPHGQALTDCQPGRQLHSSPQAPSEETRDKEVSRSPPALTTTTPGVHQQRCHPHSQPESTGTDQVSVVSILPRKTTSGVHQQRRDPTKRRSPPKHRMGVWRPPHRCNNDVTTPPDILRFDPTPPFLPPLSLPRHATRDSHTSQVDDDNGHALYDLRVPRRPAMRHLSFHGVLFRGVSADRLAGPPSPVPSVRPLLKRGKRPSLVWIESRKDEEEPGLVPYEHLDVNHLMQVPGNEGYIGRSLLDIRGNVLRGRERNEDAIFVWYVDEFRPVKNLITNQTIHGTLPTLIGDTLGEMIWAGPMVIAVREDSTAMDPRRCKDITLEAYRDAIDYLGFYRDGHGSVTDGIGATTPFAKRLLGARSGKVAGVRVNCARDRATNGGIDLAAVRVPKMHPLFNLEGDDPLPIPEMLGHIWVAKVYGGGSGPTRGLENSMAQLLFIRPEVQNGRWVGSQEKYGIEGSVSGNVLIVDRTMHTVREEEVRSVCKFIQDVAVPLMTEEAARAPDGEDRIMGAIKEAAGRYME
ncbi:hypothetical protein Q7P37_000243 [Cladosporium fusiforme]